MRVRSSRKTSDRLLLEDDANRPRVGCLDGDQPFSSPFRVVPAKAGPTLLCAYSDWASDTAAAAQITINAVGGALPGPVPPLPLPPGPGKPVNTKKPKVARSGKKLTCS